MKQKWFVSCIGAVTLALAAIAFTGCYSTSGVDNNLRLHFDSAKLSAEYYDTGNPIASGDIVADNTWVTFTAKLSGDDFTVAKWHIGNRSFIPGTVEPYYYYRINEENKNSSNVIAVSYKEREKTRCTISFNDSKIECKKWNEDRKDYTDEVPSGTALEEGTKIEFSVKTLTTNGFADFSLSGIEIKNKNARSGRKQVHDQYAQDDTITITYKEREAKQFKITFDDNTIECKQDNISVKKMYADYAYVYEGYPLTFTAKDSKEHIWHVGWRYWKNKKKVFEIVPNADYFNLYGGVTSVYYTE